MPNRTRRRAAWIVAVAFAVALLASAGHRHEQHQASEVGCAVCAVAHHSPALASGEAPSIAPAADAAMPQVRAAIIPASQRQGSLETGRAPPRPTFA